MDANDTVFAGAIPELYDRFLVPLIFETYAWDLTARVARESPRRVLEIAAGTGAVTRVLAPALPEDATIVAIDLNQPMLDRAVARQGDDARVTFRQADAQALPFPDHSFDAALCQFGVMFFPDRVGAYREAGRVLVPAAHYHFNVWDELPANEIPARIEEAVGEMFGDGPPQFLRRTPYGYFDRDRIRAELDMAGFSEVSLETVDRICRGRSAREVAMTFCQGTPLRGEIEARRPGGLAEVTDHVAAVLEQEFGAGPIEGRIRAVVVDAKT